MGSCPAIREGGQKAVKLFHDRLPDSEAEYEAYKQRIAYSQGLPVPQVFEVTRINGKQAIIMEHVKGTPFGDLMQQDGAHMETYPALCVDIQIEIHSKTT